MLASKFITKARIKLADTIVPGRTPRWTDEELLEGLNEGLQTIFNDFKIHKTKTSFVPTPFQGDYDVSDTISEITRVEYGDTGRINFRSREELDEHNPQWPTVVGDPKYVITDLTDGGLFSLYPKPDNKQFNNTAYNIISTGNFGALTTIDYNGTPKTIDQLLAEGTVQASDYTGLYGIPDIDLVVIKELFEAKVWGYEAYKTVTIGLHVPIDRRLNIALVDYIISYALGIGYDTENRDLSKRYLSKFLMRCKSIEKKVRNSGGRRHSYSDYNNGFNQEQRAN